MTGLPPDDLTKLNSLDPDSIEAALRERYNRDAIYSNINTLLVALNPYKRLPDLYSDRTLKEYMQYASMPDKPHVYGVAADAYRGLLESRSQSLVISGESGAGKTETSKIILQYLAQAATNTRASSGLEGRIIASTPVLESFGNARTAMNDNSSRYGKFLMLQFDVSGKITGANISTYLLEKSRVIVQTDVERNYHSLYQLCASGSTASALGVRSPEAYKLLGHKAQREDVTLFQQTEQSLVNVGFSTDEREATWRLLAATLALGNLTFGSAQDAEAAVQEPQILTEVAKHLRCDEAGLSFALTKRKIRAGRDFIDTPNTVTQAGFAREGMVKAVYSRLFDWVVSRVNVSLSLGEQPMGPGGSARFFIGILDIFGFEHFEKNSLEQLCINFTNEKLQNRFNEAVFSAAQEENLVEGVQVEDADLRDFDNQEVLDLIEAHPGGILAMLNEECVVPQGSDETLQEKLNKQHVSNKRFKKVLRAKDSFEVVHYAGRVQYQSTGMLAKNKDTVSEDMLALMSRSDDPLVRQVFATPADAQNQLARKRGAKFQGVVAKFQGQLNELTGILDASDMHFIRCIKPNMGKLAGSWQQDTVMRQLRCSGVLEVVRVFGMGYPDRVPHGEIVSRFACVLRTSERPDARLGEKAACEAVLKRLCQPRDYAVGRTKAFLKSGVLARLRTLREEQISRKSSYIQARVRGKIQRKRWKVIWQEHLERKAREEEERRKREEEERKRREEEEQKRRRDAELARMTADERARALKEDRAREAEKAAEDREARRRKEEEEYWRRLHEEGAAGSDGRLSGAGGLGGQGSARTGPGFALNMGAVTNASQKANALEDSTQQWTPRARPKDAPKQSARYQNEFKALPEDILEYAVYLGMDPTQDQDLLWIAEEALLAPDPPGWVEMLDPHGLLYFYNETTGQSSRQHPLDEHYQNLYLKMKMQRGLKGGGDANGRANNANLTTDDLQKRREALAAEFANAADGATGDLATTMTSIQQALSLSTPRSTKALTEKFGISKPDTDVRALLINPARYGEPLPAMNEAQMTREATSSLFPRLVLYLVLNDNYKAFAFSATKRVNSSRTEFVISLDQEEGSGASPAASFAGRLRTNQKAQEWVMHDDSNDPYGLKTGKPRRELGLVVFKKKMIGPIQAELVIPRVRKDGACAQFRPNAPEEAMLQLYKAGRCDHMFILRGGVAVQPGGTVELTHEVAPNKGHVVLRCNKLASGAWNLSYMHPLSAFQAFNFLVAVINNPITAALDALPQGEAPGAGGPAPPLGFSGQGGRELLGSKGQAAIVNTATLEGLGDAVYALAVDRFKVFSGLYSGDIQVWHMDHYVNLPSGSKPEYHNLKGHTGPVCALVVHERALFSASEDKTIIVWDLNTMRKKQTLKGHKQRVRAIALYKNVLCTGGNDKAIKVWSLDNFANTNTVDAHTNWIRAMAIFEGTHLVTGSRDKTVKVWDMVSWQNLGIFDASADVYTVAVGGGFVYGGCADYKIRVWNLSTMQKSYLLQGHEGIVRQLYLNVASSTLFSCSEDKKVKVWDLKSGDCVTLFGHTKFIRSIGYDIESKTLYSAGDDAKIKVWEARA